MSSCLPCLLTPGETVVSALQFLVEIFFFPLLSISPVLLSLTVLSFAVLHVPGRINLYIFSIFFNKTVLKLAFHMECIRIQISMLLHLLTQLLRSLRNLSFAHKMFEFFFSSLFFPITMSLSVLLGGKILFQCFWVHLQNFCVLP